MTGLIAALLRRRLLIVSGKGGTGRTSVSAALALLAARAGIRASAIELGPESLLPRLLVERVPEGAGQPRSEPQPLAEGLHHMRITPEFALTEYLEKQLRAPRLARAIVANSGIRRLLDAAPGWRDLIALGKLWHLSTRESAGRARWPLLIIDAPATGHGLSLLSGPAAATELVRSGPLRRHVDEVLALLRDPARSLVLPVALAEELPVNEVLELREGVRALGVAVGPVIANGLEPALPDAGRLLAALPHLPSPAASPLLSPVALRRVLEERLARRALQERHLARLTAATGEAPLELPYLSEGIDGPSGCAALAASLERAASHPGAAA
jgi:anion-transporting  ArsA/GET3 family ATPase